ncbi:hypothetical protein [Sulfurimonas sp.]|mgnify:CR=1 FL=1|jgi:hypothetical protein|uniref:hypothetical protein n=1 Tax=Sulfurimonas sp. TaxID=2022749 RepID=UPI0025E3C249|nr:hypothetical protein [Sulfurimonas sp.]MBT5934946.1 DUF1059 domain-containing protein [Sulfurimonas sp.]
MKTMTCKQLGGACDKTFQAETFNDMVGLSKRHGMEMFLQEDAAHLKVMNEAKELMQKPEEMLKWFKTKEEEFNAIPND